MSVPIKKNREAILFEGFKLCFLPERVPFTTATD